MRSDGRRLKIDLVAAARPNFMKVAPLYHALGAERWCEVRLVHTGQHYDANMSDAFLQDLQLPPPDVHLGVGSGSHAQQTGSVMIAYEEVCNASRPDLIVVVGDVNSTLACALVGAKQQIPVAHLEAGLRSEDRTMPEEINRLVTDAVADILWTPSPDADSNLAREGIPPAKITRVGNIMIDSYELMRERILTSSAREDLQLEEECYGVLTLHRPVNVDRREPLTKLLGELLEIGRKLPLVFPIHPRTRKNLERFGLWQRLEAGNIRAIQPLGYVDFMNLILGCRLAITDSGGIQEETTYLGIPCLTLRTTTERPVTVTEGTNQLVNVGSVGAAVEAILRGEGRRPGKVALWDGKAAVRVRADIKRRLLRKTADSEYRAEAAPSKRSSLL